MSNGVLQLILTVVLIVAGLILVLSGHSTDPLTSAVVGILGVAAGFFFRDGVSAINKSRSDNDV